jgi:SAM-dependent methyltransferase
MAVAPSSPGQAAARRPSSCIACGGTDWASIPYPLPRSALFQDLSIAVCRDCGLGAVRQPIDPARLQHYYEHVYAGHAGRDDKPGPDRYFSDPAQMFKPQRSLSQLRLANQRLATPPRRILDLGAGFGTTLYLARREFWPKAELVAVEPDASMREYLAAIDCRQLARLDEAEPRSCDLIIASHILEHYQVDEIADGLTRLRSLLSPGGMLLAEVPNSNFLTNPEIAGHSHEPHLLFFSRQAFRKVIEKSGFYVSFLDTAGPLRRRRLRDRLAARLRRLAGKPAGEYGGERAALRLLAN